MAQARSEDSNTLTTVNQPQACIKSQQGGPHNHQTCPPSFTEWTWQATRHVRPEWFLRTLMSFALTGTQGKGCGRRRHSLRVRGSELNTSTAGEQQAPSADHHLLDGPTPSASARLREHNQRQRQQPILGSGSFRSDASTCTQPYQHALMGATREFAARAGERRRRSNNNAQI